MAVFEISLDVSKASVVPKAVRARVGDSESCVIKATVTRSGTEYDLTGKGVRFECMLPDGSFVRDAGVEVDGSTIEYAVPAEILRSPGIVKVCYFRIFQGTEVIDSTETLSLDVKPGLDPCSLEVPGDYLPELDEALVDGVAARLLALPGTRYYTGHCTGLASYARLKEKMGQRVAYLHAGETLEL